MIWDDTGFLLSKNRYSENSLITEIYTKNHGKISGLIFGGTSKKIKNYLQIGNNLHINFNSKSENRIGYFKIEIQQALSPIYFDDNKKLSCISLAMNLIRLLTAEAQKNQSIYELINDFYILLKEKNWIKRYVFWELDLFKVLGYDLEFSNLVDKKIHEKYLEHEDINNLKGLKVDLIYKWKMGDLLIFDRTNLHCSSCNIKTKKLGFTTSTKIL